MSSFFLDFPRKSKGHLVSPTPDAYTRDVIHPQQHSPHMLQAFAAILRGGGIISFQNDPHLLHEFEDRLEKR